MTSTLISNIGQLVTNDPSAGDGSALGVMTDCSLVLVDGRVTAHIPSGEALPACDERIDAGGGCVIPAFVDSHNHLVFAGDRAAEFAARMAGQPYAAGGIMSTVRDTRAATDIELLARTRQLTAEAQSKGTGAMETKSGYELTADGELRP